MRKRQLRAAGSSPLKDGPEEQEADSHGYGSPQIGQLGEHFSVMVGQISPAVALGEPDPVCPHRLAQPRQHPERKNLQQEGCAVSFLSSIKRLLSVRFSLNKHPNTDLQGGKQTAPGGQRIDWL